MTQSSTSEAPAQDAESLRLEKIPTQIPLGLTIPFDRAAGPSLGFVGTVDSSGNLEFTHCPGGPCAPSESD